MRAWFTANSMDEGKQVLPAQPLLNLIPLAATLQADVYLPSRAAGFVRVGTRALLQFQAFPYQKFGQPRGARRQAVTRRSGRKRVALSAACRGNWRAFDIASLALTKSTVLAYGNEEPLQSGMGFDANLVLDTRTLLEWVFEPLFSVSGNWIH